MSIEIARENGEAKNVYINTRIFMRSVGLFFKLRSKLTISSLTVVSRKMFSTSDHRKLNGKIFE